MKFMDKLPTLTNCCFCCFLRAGTVLIALTSFTVGMLFVPNVAHTRGYWDLNSVLLNYSTLTEMTVQMILGVSSIMLCVISCLLLIGACCNVPLLIELYQWGVLTYTSIVLTMFGTLTCFCFFIHNNCYLAGGVLCILTAVLIMISSYFIVVVNSFRMSLKMMNSNDSMI